MSDEPKDSAFSANFTVYEEGTGLKVQYTIRAYRPQDQEYGDGFFHFVTKTIRELPQNGYSTVDPRMRALEVQQKTADNKADPTKQETESTANAYVIGLKKDKTPKVIFFNTLNQNLELQLGTCYEEDFGLLPFDVKPLIEAAKKWTGIAPPTRQQAIEDKYIQYMPNGIKMRYVRGYVPPAKGRTMPNKPFDRVLAVYDQYDEEIEWTPTKKQQKAAAAQAGKDAPTDDDADAMWDDIGQEPTFYEPPPTPPPPDTTPLTKTPQRAAMEREYMGMIAKLFNPQALPPNSGYRHINDPVSQWLLKIYMQKKKVEIGTEYTKVDDTHLQALLDTLSDTTKASQLAAAYQRSIST